MQTFPSSFISFGMAYKHVDTEVDDMVKSFETPREIRVYDSNARRLHSSSNRRKMDVKIAKSPDEDTFTLSIEDKKGREIKTAPYSVTADVLTDARAFKKLRKNIEKDLKTEQSRLKTLDKILKKHGSAKRTGR